MATTQKTVKKETTKKTEPAKTPVKKTATKTKTKTEPVKLTVIKKTEPAKKATVKKEAPAKEPVKKTPAKKTAPAKKSAPKTNERIKAEDMAPATPTMDTFPTIQRGAKGAHVTLLQANLMSRGYKIASISGNFDDETFNALKEFKRDNNLPINGIVGPKVWEALRTSTVKAKAAEAAKKEVLAAYPADVKMEAANPADLHFQPIANPKTSLVIDGLTRYQAELLAKMFKGGIECRIIETR